MTAISALVDAGVRSLGWVHEQERRRHRLVVLRPVVPLPGTTRIEHLAANLAAADLRLDNTDLQRLDAAV